MTTKKDPGGKDIGGAARRWFGRGPENLTDRERRVLNRIASRRSVSIDVHAVYEEGQTFGQRLADKVAEFGGSWTFIILFACVLAAWALVNSVLLVTEAFDPYPYIFLNLILSMLAAVQAPVIMMSQNRQAEKDRLAAQHDYEVNLKAEIEIMALHDKLDQLRNEQLTALVSQQQEQIRMLTVLLAEHEAREREQRGDG